MLYKSRESRGLPPVQDEQQILPVPKGMYRAMVDIVKNKNSDKYGGYVMIGWRILEPTPGNGANLVFQNFYLTHPEDKKRDNAEKYYEQMVKAILDKDIPNDFYTNQLQGLEAVIEVDVSEYQGRTRSSVIPWSTAPVREWRGNDDQKAEPFDQFSDNMPF